MNLRMPYTDNLTKTPLRKIDRFDGPSACALDIQKWNGHRGTLTKKPRVIKKSPQKEKVVSKKKTACGIKSSWKKKRIKPKKMKNEPTSAQIRIKKDAWIFL
jgi:hypothetical protein